MELPGVGGRGARELVFNEDSVSVFQDEKMSKVLFTHPANIHGMFKKRQSPR